eukprot:6199480-Pleurochrysis_carterae.AAC.1
MHRLVPPGIEFNQKGPRGAPFLVYADDGIIITLDTHTATSHGGDVGYDKDLGTECAYQGEEENSMVSQGYTTMRRGGKVTSQDEK